MFSLGFKNGASAFRLQFHIAYQQISIYPTQEEGKHFFIFLSVTVTVCIIPPPAPDIKDSILSTKALKHKNYFKKILGVISASELMYIDALTLLSVVSSSIY